VDTLKAGIVGTGGRGVFAFGKGILARQSQIELCALCDHNSLRLKAAAAELGVELPLFTDYRELLAQPHIDVVFISTPDCTHEEIAVAAFDAGKHVLCEKPLATTVTGCDRILEASRRAGRQLEVGFVLRYAPLFGELRRIIADGRIGPLHLVESGDYYKGGSSYFRRWNRLSAMSGGLLVHKGTHTLDILNWIIDREPLRVAAFSGIDRFRPDPDKGERCLTCQNRCDDYFDITQGYAKRMYLDCESEDGYIFDVCLYNSDKDTHDNATVIIEYAGGARATYTECFFTATSSRRFRFVGELGEIRADEATGEIHIDYRYHGEPESIVPSGTEGSHGGGDAGQMDAFLGAIRTGKPALASGEAGRLSVVVAIAAERSARETRMVEIAEMIGGA